MRINELKCVKYFEQCLKHSKYSASFVIIVVGINSSIYYNRLGSEMNGKIQLHRRGYY